MKAYTSLEQSKKLAELLPHESADMEYILEQWVDEKTYRHKEEYCETPVVKVDDDCPLQPITHPCWSLAALFDVLPKINGVNLKFERVKAEDGYNGYYYHIEYEDKILIPYCKNLTDACVEMVLQLHEQKLL